MSAFSLWYPGRDAGSHFFVTRNLTQLQLPVALDPSSTLLKLHEPSGWRTHQSLKPCHFLSPKLPVKGSVFLYSWPLPARHGDEKHPPKCRVLATEEDCHFKEALLDLSPCAHLPA
jgi:hypothetical protein